MVKLIILLILPGMASAQFFMRIRRPMLIPKYDSATAYYDFNMNPGGYTVYSVKDSSVISFPELVRLPKYIGKSTGTPDTLVYFNKGNILTTAKSNLTLNHAQVEAGRRYTRPARGMGITFVPNSNRDVFVSYTVSIEKKGALYLEVSANNTTWIEMARVSVDGVANLSGIIPAGYYCRLRGTGTLLNGIETVL